MVALVKVVTLTDLSVGCPAGTYRNSGMDTCVRCDNNTVRASGASVCTACEVNTLANERRTECGELICSRYRD